MLTNTSGIIDVMTRNVRISSVTSQHQDYAICCLILTHNTHTHILDKAVHVQPGLKTDNCLWLS